MAKEKNIDFDKMTEEELIEYVNKRADNDRTKQSLNAALNGYRGLKANRKKTFRLLRQALNEGRNLRIGYYDGESCDGPRKRSLDVWIGC